MSMAEFQYGIMAVYPQHGFLSAQDLRRFDLVACVAEGDQTAADIRAGVDSGDVLELPVDAFRSSVLWAWTRDAGHVEYAAAAEDAIRAQATALQDRFGTPELPLLITDAHEKVARVAVAFAALLHSTDSSHERVIVLPVHVDLAERLFTTFYAHDNCGLDQYTVVIRRRTGLTDDEYAAITESLLTPGSNREDVSATETLLDLFTTEDDIPRLDLEAASGLGRDALNSRLGRLRAFRLIQSSGRGYRKTARFVAFLRRWALTRSNPPNQSAGVTRGVSPREASGPVGDTPAPLPIPRVRRVKSD
jgi:hypothetical protein